MLPAGGGAEPTGAEIAAVAVGRGRRWVDKWLARYRGRGLAGLEPGDGRGNKPTPTTADLARLKARTKKPTAADGGRTAPRGKDARRVPADEFGEPVALSMAHKRLHDAGLSCLRPRPKHRKDDPEKTKAWLDRAPLSSGR